MREMKDSGIEWIGEVPNDWRIVRNKNAFVCNKELVGEKSELTQLLSLTTRGIKKKDINNAEGKLPESFDIIANPKKRIIHLYDIPLSAGLGENMLDSDIPFVEYETDVEDGDFALHVSGDSMEPDIPNGSTVFVKKQSEIADGISGAFFLNGEVYCKKLLHKDGKVFLCSDNAEYHPIEIHDGDTLKVYGKIVKVLC